MHYGKSLSRSRSRSRSIPQEAENPRKRLYVIGLSPRITKRELEKYFAAEGKVIDVHLVVDPWTRESRGFGFVTMVTLGEANRCVKYLDCFVIMVEKLAITLIIFHNHKFQILYVPSVQLQHLCSGNFDISVIYSFFCFIQLSYCQNPVITFVK
ncbi:unnamed protein product [Vicia faba]|uniref:RRM domain-containing protein n=1 Tax=Vicia faba TaxID=3906 RepID=A0AAV0ZRM3_VICFA|nr:unnamed protein product [Vicia faba]